MKKFILFLALTLSILHADSFKIGSNIQLLNDFDYETPKSRKMKIPLKSKTVLIAFQKDTAAVINEYLSAKSADFLQKNKAVFISDIHKMPAIITSLFALPKLKKHKHPIYLHYTDRLEKLVPKKDEKITVMKFEEQILKSVSFISTKDELSEVFK